MRSPRSGNPSTNSAAIAGGTSRLSAISGSSLPQKLATSYLPPISSTGFSLGGAIIFVFFVVTTVAPPRRYHFPALAPKSNVTTFIGFSPSAYSLRSVLPCKT
jgi:hypothetical protein